MKKTKDVKLEDFLDYCESVISSKNEDTTDEYYDEEYIAVYFNDTLLLKELEREGRL